MRIHIYVHAHTYIQIHIFLKSWSAKLEETSVTDHKIPVSLTQEILYN